MFVNDILLPYSPVKHQTSTASCWAFSLCSYWETELAVMSGEEVPSQEFSPLFLARHKIERLCQLSMRNPFFPVKRLPVGAQGQTAVDLVQKFGLADIRSYRISDNGQTKGYRTMMRIIQVLVWLGQLTIVFRAPLLRLVCRVIDRYWAPLPDSSLIKHEPLPAITFFTSFSHLPFHEDVVLPLPDNFEGWSFANLPIDELIAQMKSALSNGHSVVWQGHLGRGCSMKKGFAVLPQNVAVTDDLRSQLFLEGKITDDHMMHIVGMAHDENERLFFIVKNSVGDIGPHHGLIYMEENYIRLNTVAVGL